MPEILFTPEAHEYRVNGVIQPSVTQVLCATGLVDQRWFDDVSAWRGSVVHRLCELDDEDDLDDDDVDPLVRGYLEAWRLFKRELQFKPQLIEHRVTHPQFGYAGTLDRTGHFGDGTKVLIDIKSGAPAAATGLQIAAYAACLEEPRTYRRFAVQLTSEGRYKSKEYFLRDYTRDRDRFLTALSCYRIQQEFGVCRI